MNTGYPRQQQQSSITDGGPGWMLVCLIMAVAVGLAALPWIILGFIAQRLLQRWLHWRVSFLLWFVLLFLGAFAIFNSYVHGGLELLWQNELKDYIVAAKLHQYDLAAYPLKQLWSETWPVWLHTWQSIGIAGLAGELIANRSDTARTLRQDEQRRIQRAQRIQHRARRRTSRPTHIPDETGGHMVIGIPIADDEEE